MWNKRLLLIFAFCFSCSIGLAEAYNGTPNFLLQFNQALPQSQHNELIFTYNSKKFDGSLLDKYSKAELIELIKTNTVLEIEKSKKKPLFIFLSDQK